MKLLTYLILFTLLMPTAFAKKTDAEKAAAKQERQAKREKRKAERAEKKAKKLADKEAKCTAKAKTHEWTGKRCKKKKVPKVKAWKLGSKSCKEKSVKETKLEKSSDKYFKSQSDCEAKLAIKCNSNSKKEFKDGKCQKKGQEKVNAFVLSGKQCKQKQIKKAKLDKGKKAFATEAECTAALKTKCEKGGKKEMKDGKCVKKGQEKVTAYVLSGKSCKSKQVKKSKLDKGKKAFATQAECDAALKTKCEKSGKKTFYQGQCVKTSKLPAGAKASLGIEDKPKESLVDKYGEKAIGLGKTGFQAGKGMIEGNENKGMPGAGSDTPASDSNTNPNLKTQEQLREQFGEPGQATYDGTGILLSEWVKLKSKYEQTGCITPEYKKKYTMSILKMNLITEECYDKEHGRGSIRKLKQENRRNKRGR